MVDRLAAWHGRSDAERAAIIADLVALLVSRLPTTLYSTWGGQPTAEVFAASEHDGQLAVHFVAHHFNCHVPQSGSELINHYLFVGEAVFDHTRRVRESMSMIKDVSISEWEANHYDAGAAAAIVRHAAIAALDGAPLDVSGVDALVREARAAVHG